jgi:hypothetical protein
MLLTAVFVSTTLSILPLFQESTPLSQEIYIESSMNKIVTVCQILLAKSLRISIRAGEERCGVETLAAALWSRQQHPLRCKDIASIIGSECPHSCISKRAYFMASLRIWLAKEGLWMGK